MTLLDLTPDQLLTTTRVRRRRLDPVGNDFRPATRPTPDAVIHWDRW